MKNTITTIEIFILKEYRMKRMNTTEHGTALEAKRKKKTEEDWAIIRVFIDGKRGISSTVVCQGKGLGAGYVRDMAKKAERKCGIELKERAFNEAEAEAYAEKSNLPTLTATT